MAEGTHTPQAQVVGQAMQSSLVQVSPRQKSNPVLSLLAHVKWEFCEGLNAADYVCGSALVVFVSLKFHLLKSTYVERRLKEMGSMGRLRVLLVYCDDDDQRGVAASMLEINKLCFEHNFTCLLAWSDQECARYIETLKLYEKRGAAAITERSETDFLPRITKVLGNVRSINKTDASTLLETFGSFQGVCGAEAHQLALIPGFGEKKVKRLHAALNAPLRRGAAGAGAAGAGAAGAGAGAGAGAETATGAGAATWAGAGAGGHTSTSTRGWGPRGHTQRTCL